MKLYRYIFFLLLLLTGINGFAQSQKPEWFFSSSPGTEGNIILNIKASIPPGMVIFSNNDPQGFTNIEFDSSIAASVEILSSTAKGELAKEFPEIGKVLHFEKQFDISLVLKLKTPLASLKGRVNYIGRSDSSGEIIGPETIEFVLTRQADGSFTAGEFQLKTGGGNEMLIPALDIDHPVNDCGVQKPDIAHSSLLTIFFLGFLGGLLALITPCVFPMIPLTVSFFTQKEEIRRKGIGNGFLYGLFIFLIYVALSIPFHAANIKTEIYNEISTNIYLNLAFFVIFLVFAVSFFGFFEISLPSGLANRADSKRGKHFLGIFFMALTLVIVSFSCTGPILGTLLANVAADGAWPLTAGLAGFGLALGLPFALFALFPQMLKSLPRSGSWLTTVKVVFGYIELALAFKFFSNADLVKQWGILKRETFFAIWIIISFAIFIYLMGWFSLKKEYNKPTIGVARKIFAFIFLGLGLYMIPGLTNTKYSNVALVSGFVPPSFYSIYDRHKPLDDYARAVKLAKESGKPIMIDFTGWACTNCRKMEEHVWTKGKVSTQMDKFVLVSLYVDDKKELPPDQQFVYKMKDSSNKKIVTIGDKWATFQSENFKAVSQPWYVLITPEGKLLAPPVGYTDAVPYAKWLECGYAAWEKTK